MPTVDAVSVKHVFIKQMQGDTTGLESGKLVSKHLQWQCLQEVSFLWKSQERLRIWRTRHHKRQGGSPSSNSRSLDGLLTRN